MSINRRFLLIDGAQVAVYEKKPWKAKPVRLALFHVTEGQEVTCKDLETVRVANYEVAQ